MSIPKFTRFHDAYRFFRAQGLSQSLALKKVQRQYPELNKAFCLAQERHETWTREPLDEKHYSPDQLQGRLH